jgi:hypothetical protein
MARARMSSKGGDAHLEHLRDELDAALQDTDRLRAQLEHVMDTNRSLSVLLLNSDARGGELMKMLVAVRALIESRDAASALAGLEDILVNVVGTADYLIYSLDEASNSLIPIAALGEAFSSSGSVSLDGSWLGDVVRTGEVLISRPRTGARRRPDHQVAAVVPLRVLDRVLGAIVIGEVLPHRDALDLCDREVLRLLGAYAATAIIAADRRGEWNQLPVALK